MVVVGADFGGGAVPEGRVQPLPVVEHLDVLHDVEPCSCAGGERVTVVHLVLEHAEERLGNGVVPAHPGAPDGQPHAGAGGEGGVFGRGVDTGLNRWKQHLIGGCCGKTIELDEGSDRASADAVTWRTIAPASEGA